VWMLPGAAPFVAPELICRFRGGHATDCFQLGLVMHRVLTRRHPFGRPSVPSATEGDPAMTLLDFALPTLVGAHRIRTGELRNIHPDVAELVTSLLRHDSIARPRAADALRILEKL